MKQTSCKICGSTEIQQKENSIYCLSCGNKYTIPQNTKEITVNYDKEIKNYYQIALSACNNGNYIKGIEFCYKILEINCNHADALFLLSMSMFFQKKDTQEVIINLIEYKNLTSSNIFIEKTTDMLNQYMLILETIKNNSSVLTYILNILNFFMKYQNTFGENHPSLDEIIVKLNKLLIYGYNIEEFVGYKRYDYSMEFIGEEYITIMVGVLDLLKNFKIEDDTKNYITNQTANFYEKFLPDAYKKYAEGRFSSPRNRSYPSQNDHAELRKIYVFFTNYGEYLLKTFTDIPYCDREKLCNALIEHIDYFKDAQYKVGGRFYGFTDEGKKNLEEIMQKFENFKY